jgi:hypothetical protein
METSMLTRTPAPLVAVIVICACDSLPSGQDTIDPSTCDLPSRHLYSGGPPPDGIPALNDPRVLSAEGPSYRDDDRVLGVERNGAFRAYPLLVLWWHEVVNDTLGGDAVLVTYCPLTGSGLAYDPRIGDARQQFGVSGLLFENNLIMFDRATRSLWPQLLLSARCGPQRNTPLRQLPLVETTWGAWRTTHPTTTVVSTNTGHQRPYGEYPYDGDYDTPTNPDLLFPSSPYSDARPPKELVLGVREDTTAVAYPFGYLDSLGVELLAINDTVSGRAVLVTYQRAPRTGVAFDRVVDGDTLEFAVSAANPALLEDRTTRSLWSPWGEAVAGPLAGAKLRPLEDAYPMFWFAWFIFHPDTRIYRGTGGSGVGALVQATK